MALSFFSCCDFVREEFVLLNGTLHWCFHANLDRLEIQDEMSMGAYEFHSECLALSFISSLHFIRIEAVVSVGTRHSGKFLTDSDGFEMHAEVGHGMYELHSWYWHSDSFRGLIL